jgi:hypothetical protein
MQVIRLLTRQETVKEFGFGGSRLGILAKVITSSKPFTRAGSCSLARRKVRIGVANTLGDGMVKSGARLEILLRKVPGVGMGVVGD